MWVSLGGGGGGGNSSEAGGGGGKNPESVGGDGKSLLAWLTLACSAKGRWDKLSLPGLGGAGGPAEGSLDGELLLGHGEGGVGVWVVF